LSDKLDEAIGVFDRNAFTRPDTTDFLLDRTAGTARAGAVDRGPPPGDMQKATA